MEAKLLGTYIGENGEKIMIDLIQFPDEPSDKPIFHAFVEENGLKYEYHGKFICDELNREFITTG